MWDWCLVMEDDEWWWYEYFCSFEVEGSRWYGVRGSSDRAKHIYMTWIMNYLAWMTFHWPVTTIQSLSHMKNKIAILNTTKIQHKFYSSYLICSRGLIASCLSIACWVASSLLTLQQWRILRTKKECSRQITLCTSCHAAVKNEYSFDTG